MQAFGENQEALQTVRNAWNPVLQSGQIPYGFSPQLDSLLKSNVINTNATATANAENAAQLSQRQASGGAPGLAPAGAQQAEDALLEQQGQQSLASGLQQEKLAGYQEGVTNLEAGTNAELGIAGNTNEVGLASGTNSAGALGLNAGEAQFNENQTSSFGGILGDVTGGMGAFTQAADIGAMF